MAVISKIFRGENEGKANYTALISESFNYNCSFKRVISSYSWTVNPCRCAHIMSPSFTATRRKLGLYLCTRDLFPYNNRIVIKGKSVTQGKSTSLITRWTWASPAAWSHQCWKSSDSDWASVGNCKLQLHRKAPEETTGSMENQNNNLSLDHSWVPVKCPLCPACVWNSRWSSPCFLKPNTAN